VATWNGHPVLRGRVYRAELPHVSEPKWYLVVSNNERNRQLPQVLAVRLTTSPKPELPSIVELQSPQDGPFAGRATCDDLEVVWGDEIREDRGAITPAAMQRVEAGLRAALGMTH
jgi:mRNA interferase MazF